MKRHAARIWAALLAVSLLFLSACGGGNAAASICLRRTQGTVSVSNGSGKSLPLLDNMSLYSGYGVGTQSASYAWIDLDGVKLTKLDQNSEAAVEKEGRALTVEVKSGSLFFNVTEPLEDGETLNIRTSTMLVGIRGTRGWVEENGGLSRVYLLEGKVECSAGGRTVQVRAGEFAQLTADGELAVKEFTEQDIPAFVRSEVDNPDTDPGFFWEGVGDDNPDDNSGLSSGVLGDRTKPGTDTSDAPESGFVPQGTVVASGDDAGENVKWALYNDGTLFISGTGLMGNNNRPWDNLLDRICTVIIDEGVTSIALGAFIDCGSLVSVTIPESVTLIGVWAFENCTSLTSVTFSGSNVKIAASVFANCPNLRDVYFGGSEEQWRYMPVGAGNDALRSANIHYNSPGN